MILDLRNDAQDIYKLIVKRVKDYVANEAEKLGPVSAIGITYEFSQRGWVIVHFDNRAEHKRDGQMNYSRKEVFKRPHWFATVKALCYFNTSDFDPECGTYGRVIKRKPVTIILPNGTRKNAAKMTEKTFSAILGRLLKQIALKAKQEGRYEPLPKHTICQLDIEDFNSTWAWPKYEQLGKTNRLR